MTQMFRPGGFAELALIHENEVVQIPQAVPFPVAACSTLIGAGAVFNCAKVVRSEKIAIVGAGGED